MEEATESKGGHFAGGNSVLQKLQSYGEASNLRAAMAQWLPWPSYFRRLCVSPLVKLSSNCTYVGNISHYTVAAVAWH